MNDFLSGAITVGYLVSGLFFLRFWKRSKDVLFVYFAVAFWILAGQRFALVLIKERVEEDTIFYVIRLIAYLVILLGIWQKNRPGPRRQ